MTAFALGILGRRHWQNRSFVLPHSIGEAPSAYALLRCRGLAQSHSGCRCDALLEISASLHRLLREITFPRLPEAVEAEIVGNANAGAVTRAVAVGALCLCCLEGSHAAPPVVAPDSRNFSRSLRRMRTSFPVGFSARRRPARICRSR